MLERFGRPNPALSFDLRLTDKHVDLATEGIDVAALARRFDRAIVDEAAVARLEGHGLLWSEGTRIGTTEAGRLLLDSILAEVAA